MKFHALYDGTTGRVVQTCTGPDDNVQNLADQLGLLRFELGEDADIQAEAWVEAGEIHFQPPAPEPGMQWSWTSKTWLPNMDAMRQTKFAAIEVERDRRILAPIIVYDGANLDADMRAKNNLVDKLTEVISRIATGNPLPPEQLVWRDADNQMHTFTDMASYKAWLDGFAIAMGSRGTAAYAWSWQKKAQLAALTTVEDVVAFDPLA